MKGPIARGTLRTSAVLGLRLAVQALTLLLVARTFGPHEFGAFAGVASLALVLGIFSTFGTHLVMLSEVSRDPARRESVLRFAVPITLACGSALFLTYIAISTLLLDTVSIPATALLAIGASETLLQSLFAFPVTEHLALGRTARSQLLQTLPLALRLLAATAVFLLRPIDPLTTYACGYLAASMIALVIGTATMPGRWPSFRTWRLPSKAELRESSGYAALAVTATAPAEIDKTLALKLLPLAGAGLYAAAARVIGAATLPVVAMLLSALPRLFREGNDPTRRATQLLRWLFGTALGYGLLLGVILWLAAPAFDWLFGTQYLGLAKVIRVVTLAVPGMALRITVGNVLLAQGESWMRAGIELFGMTVLVVTAAVLTARIGVIGMPIALICSETSMAAAGGALVYWSRRHARASSP